MPFINPPASYNAQSKLYMQRLYNSIAQDIRNATSVPVVDSMPVNPKQGAYYFQNAINGSSIITQPGLYGYDGNQWIGQMDVQQWPNARIGSVAVDKLLAGQIGAIEIILANSANSIIRSANYSAGSAGWAIRGNGNAEFQNVTVRGTLNANDLLYGTIAEARFADNTIDGGPIKSGAVHKTVAQLNSQISAPYNLSLAITTGNNAYLGPLSLAANSYRSGVILFADVWPHVSATNTGNWSSGFTRNSTTGWIGNSHWFTQHENHYGMGKGMLYYDTGAGTGAVSYYLAVHQNVNGTSSQYCYCTFIALEISK